MFTSAFCKILVQAILQTHFFTIHALNLYGKTQNTYSIYWYKCTADPLRRQCIKVRGHKRYMQSKKNTFCIQYCKPRYLSITDKSYTRFRSRINSLSTILNFANCTVMRFFFCFFFSSGIYGDCNFLKRLLWNASVYLYCTIYWHKKETSVLYGSVSFEPVKLSAKVSRTSGTNKVATVSVFLHSHKV